jgi:hypothetical protein
VLYQDRLADERGALDRGLSYAIGTITSDDGEPFGVVLVAFRHERLNRAVAGKLGKGLAITLFFVALILVQNLASRRAKLRLYDLEAALSAARTAVRAALPETPALGWGRLGVAFAQADRVGGTVYDLRLGDDGTLDLLVAVPDGTGVDAAFASVVLRDLYRRVEAGEPAARAAALLAAYDQSPLGRPVELLLLRVGADGAVRGVAAGLAPPSLLADGAARPLDLGPPLPVSARRLAQPLRQFAAPLDGQTLLVFDDGMPPSAPRRFPPAEALARALALLDTHDPQRIAEDLVAAAVKRYRNKHTDDFLSVVLMQ